MTTLIHVRRAIAIALMAAFTMSCVDVASARGGGGGARGGGGGARAGGGGGARAGGGGGARGGGGGGGFSRGGGGRSAGGFSGGGASRPSGFGNSFSRDFTRGAAVPKPGGAGGFTAGTAGTRPGTPATRPAGGTGAGAAGNRNNGTRDIGSGNRGNGNRDIGNNGNRNNNDRNRNNNDRNRNNNDRRTNINSGNRTNNIVAPITPVAPAYGWNGGYPWYPAPTYWGGGFWGPFVAGVATTVVFGEIFDNETHEKVVSYEVAPDSPGAKALKAYGLTQSQCQGEGANQVVIFGPNNSVVCAAPNSTVSAGEYELDTANLTIYSRAAQ